MRGPMPPLRLGFIAPFLPPPDFVRFGLLVLTYAARGTVFYHQRILRKAKDDSGKRIYWYGLFAAPIVLVGYSLLLYGVGLHRPGRLLPLLQQLARLPLIAPPAH